MNMSRSSRRELFYSLVALSSATPAVAHAVSVHDTAAIAAGGGGGHDGGGGGGGGGGGRGGGTARRVLIVPFHV